MYGVIINPKLLAQRFHMPKLNKRHNILSFHFVHNMVAQGFINIAHIPSEFNLADILLKHWSHQAAYNNLIKLLLHYHGDVNEFYTHDSVDLSHLSHDGFVAKPLHDSFEVQFLSTWDFQINNGYIMGSQAPHNIKSSDPYMDIQWGVIQFTESVKFVCRSIWQNTLDIVKHNNLCPFYIHQKANVWLTNTYT